MNPLFRGTRAPAPRTLVDVFDATVAAHPAAPALDDGVRVLTYRQLASEVTATASALADAGIGIGARVGVRLPSGSNDLYIAILGVLAAGAAYVPVDADDPEARARTVFDEADVDGVITAGLHIEPRWSTHEVRGGVEAVSPEHDAWIIFTSGSTGTPKGVAVTHRSAAALVDAEARLFVASDPLGPGDRVLAGLSVAFDASCEEMWLAWRSGACLVPAPRALVRSGVDLGPWLVDRGITAVSTVPTLAAVWPPESLDAVRLLIFGGEACPSELAARLAVDGREVWNTYGPTEATVIACGARMRGIGPVRIGLPIDGWDLAVVDEHLEPVADGQVGELVIGGVGVARYLDPVRDAQRFIAVPALGWERAYRSGDLVRSDAEGLVFVGRADDQVKLGGRRIELGEIDAALQCLSGVAAAAAAVRRTESGNQVLVGYLVLHPGEALDRPLASKHLRSSLPAALIPRFAVVDSLPTKTSGKVDRDALPWPLPDAPADDRQPEHLEGVARLVAGHWARILGVAPATADEDFFDLGGSSLAAAELVSALRTRYPEVTVADVYDHPTVRGLADRLDRLEVPVEARRTVAPTPPATQLLQALAMVPLLALGSLRWLTWIAVANNLARGAGLVPWAPTLTWWVVAPAALLLLSPPGRLVVAATTARAVLRGVAPGTYPRGGSVHRRLWFAEAVVRATGAAQLGGAPWMTTYARLLGATVGRNVDLHTMPPVTGLLRLGKGVSVEAEVDLAGHWVDGDLVHIGHIRIGAGATVGGRSTLAPGTRIGTDAQIAPGSAVSGAVPAGELWGGSPAASLGRAHPSWPPIRPPRSRAWPAVYALSAFALALLPLLAGGAAVAVAGRPVVLAGTFGDAARAALWATPLVALVGFGLYAAIVLVLVRALGVGVVEGHHLVRSRIGWQVWATERLVDEARTYLFPIYASTVTPMWLRALGTRVGKGVEASTVLLLPKMTTIGDDAFLADDTLVASYELGGGWLHIAPTKVGKRSFLGNSGMTAPGRRLPKRSLVAVLSATPQKAKKGTSWVGSPPMQLRRPELATDVDRTFTPPRRLRAARGAVELARLVPMVATVALGVAVVGALELVWLRLGLGPAVLAGVAILAAAGVVAGASAVAAKWSLVGRIRAGEHPLWSSFVWRNELADTFVEMVAAPWLLQPVTGTPVLNVWLRAMGARVGTGAWCETYWLPEYDLVRLDDGASVNRGSVVQTHLFHDRIMSLDRVTLEAGATLGPNGVILPAATLGAASTVGPASLVMRGEVVPAASRWAGNPIVPWATTGAASPDGPAASGGGSAARGRSSAIAS